jgi:hypothetical protein
MILFEKLVSGQFEINKKQLRISDCHNCESDQGLIRNFGNPNSEISRIIILSFINSNMAYTF